MIRRRARLPAALIAAVLVAEAGVLVLRPRAGIVQPAPVRARSYFSAAQIARGEAFSEPQRALGLAGLGLEAGLLVLLVVRPPALLQRRFRRPLAAGALTGAGIALALSVVTLPLGAIAHHRAVDFGLSTQSWAGWAADVGRSAAIELAMAGAGAALLLALMRRFARAWWAPGAAAAVALGALFLYAGPLVLDPVFNRFTPLREGRTREEVLGLAHRAGVRVGQVYVVDASRRTTAANAYVTGLGPSKRVVVYDTLLEHFSPDELRLVVAHELGHVRFHDVPRGLLYLALVAPLGTLAAQRLSERWSTRPGTPAALPAVFLALALVSTSIQLISNQLSRRVEARADTFALELTHAPGPFVSFQRRIAVRNLVEVDPPGWATALLATHPPTLARIGAAVAFEHGAR